MIWLMRVLGIILIAVGLLWILQGAGIINSGFMARQMQWAFAGLVAAAIGIGLLILGSRRQRRISGPADQG